MMRFQIPQEEDKVLPHAILCAIVTSSFGVDRRMVFEALVKSNVSDAKANLLFKTLTFKRFKLEVKKLEADKLVSLHLKNQLRFISITLDGRAYLENKCRVPDGSTAFKRESELVDQYYYNKEAQEKRKKGENYVRELQG